MRQLGFWAAVVLCVAGCSDGGGETDNSPPVDAGSDIPHDAAVILDAGDEPVEPPDGVAACPAGLCNYQSGLGCPSTSPACIPLSNGQTIAPACFAAGATQGGASCANANDCVAGYFCAESSCRKLCCGGDWSGCDSPDQHCITNLLYPDGNGGAVKTGAMLCTDVNYCDALKPSGCSTAGTTCQIVDDSGATACVAQGSGGHGDACPCKGGFVCVKTPDVTECRRLCKAVAGGGDPFCQEDEGVCTHFARDPAGVGECTQTK